MKNYKFYNKENLTNNTRIDRSYDFNTAIAALNSLNEVFSYKKEEILSDEEVKEITAKIAELKPQYKEASEKRRAREKKLGAAGMSWQEIDEDSEYKKLEEITLTLWRQLSPLEKKLNRHNDIIKYQTAGDQIATKDDFWHFLGDSISVDVELEVDVYVEADEYPSGWDPRNDSITWTTTPARYGTLRRWTTEVDLTEELVANFLGKKVEEITVKDLMDFDEKGFEEYLAETDEIIEQAQKEAEKAVENSDYDYYDVDWKDEDWD